MTQEMLNMSKEELVNAIAECNKHGKDLEYCITKLSATKEKLLEECDILEQDILSCLDTMKSLAIAQAEMRKLLREKYDSFVM